MPALRERNWTAIVGLNGYTMPASREQKKPGGAIRRRALPDASASPSDGYVAGVVERIQMASLTRTWMFAQSRSLFSAASVT